MKVYECKKTARKVMTRKEMLEKVKKLADYLLEGSHRDTECYGNSSVHVSSGDCRWLTAECETIRFKDYYPMQIKCCRKRRFKTIFYLSIGYHTTVDDADMCFLTYIEKIIGSEVKAFLPKAYFSETTVKSFDNSKLRCVSHNWCISVKEL